MKRGEQDLPLISESQRDALRVVEDLMEEAADSTTNSVTQKKKDRFKKRKTRKMSVSVTSS